MVPSVDDKKYATDNRIFRDAVISDGVFKNFEDSPLTAELKVSDICTYAPGDLNKIGKEGKTSWDSFSYAIQMGHNVWSHINAVQEANRQYDNNIVPNMLVQEKHDRVFFRDVVEEIFSKSTKEESFQVIKDHEKFFMSIRGTRGYTGKNIISARPKFDALFDVEESKETVDDELDETKLEDLEHEQLD
jgi:hypothetical protein